MRHFGSDHFDLVLLRLDRMDETGDMALALEDFKRLMNEKARPERDRRKTERSGSALE